MSRHLFGWDLPPGVSQRDIDSAYGMEGPCEMCGYDADHCICLECPVCQTHGDPQCYEKHGLGRSLQQVVHRAQVVAQMEEEAKAEEEYYKSLDEEVIPEELENVGYRGLK